MEKIKIHETEYEIISIMPVATNILRIEFADTVPEEWGDITTYTVGGMEAGCISGYDTLYRVDGHIICLSNDGSVYEPPEEQELINRPMLIEEAER